MSVSLIIDLVALAIIVGFAIYGVCKGFFSMVFGVVSWILAILLTWKLYPIVAGWFANWGLKDAVVNFMNEKVHLSALKGISYDALSSAGIKKLLSDSGLGSSLETVQSLNGADLVVKLGGIAAIASATGVDLSGVDLSGLNGLGVLNDIQQGQITQAFSNFKVPEFIKKWLLSNNNAEKYSGLGVDNLGDYLSLSSADIVVNIAAILATFLVFLLIFGLVGLIFKKLSDVPVVKGVNRILGLLCGVLMGVGIIWIILFAMSFLGVTSSFEQVSTALDESKLCKLLFDINPFMALLKSALGA